MGSSTGSAERGEQPQRDVRADEADAEHDGELVNAALSSIEHDEINLGERRERSA